MNNPHSAYQQHRTNGWCRVDMLLALYQAGIRNVDEAIAAAKRDDLELSKKHRTKALRIVLELYAGLDLTYGDVPKRVAQLCEFMQHVLLTGQFSELQNVRDVLATLEEGFLGIREEAIRLEEAGEIPGIAASTLGGITT